MYKPKVSVCVITCNQKEYIGDCLQSLVTQETNYPFEIIVGDDASTDGTTLIVQEYADKYPKIIKAFLHKKKIGGTQNYFSVHNLAQGEYVAHIDGDDYALPNKLQSQVDFLDENPACVMVFHECLTILNNQIIHENFLPQKKYKVCDFLEFLYLYPGKTWHSSKMYRNCMGTSLLYKGKEFIDKNMHFEHGTKGMVGFINKPLGVYRANIGISNKIHDLQKMVLDSYEYARKLNYNERIITKIIAREHFEYGLRCLSIKDYINFKKNICLGFKGGHRNFRSLFALAFQDYPLYYIRLKKTLKKLGF